MSASPRLRSVQTRSGQLSVEVDNIPYHSPYDPGREAHKFYGSYSIEKADVILHFGWGLGYGAEILRQRMKPSARVVVFEPDGELFRLFTAQSDNRVVLEDARFRFIVGAQISHFFDEWMFDGCQETDKFLWLIWPAAHEIHGPTEAALTESFRIRLRDRAANLLTHFQNGKTYFENVLVNSQYQGDPDAGILFGRFQNVPLVIVSAGPSLDRNVRELRGHENRCFILAVDTALRPLLTAGIVPHAVVIADPSLLNARHIVDAMPDSTYLIAEQGVHLAALQSARRRFLFGLGLFPDSLFAKFGFAKSRLDVWGSVATAALDLALKMRANPVIFTGQDFGYSWNRDYAHHTIFDGNAFDVKLRATRYETDLWNASIGTTANLVAYHDFFVRKIRQTSGVRFINATEGGILRDGVDVLSLRDALYQACTTRIDVGQRLQAAHGAAPLLDGALKCAIGHLSAILESRTGDCSCLEEFLNLAAKEALLRGDRRAIDETILWGQRLATDYTDYADLKSV
jgi:hypothetical protein